MACSSSPSTCIDLAHDPAHCGACDHACSAAEVCDEGTCRSSCPTDRTVCGGSCRDVRWDPAHCGACDHACEAGHVCSEGVCSFSCAGGTTRCGDACVDVRHDPGNCGACGVACAKGATCVEGACACPTTAPDVCGATCVDTKTDPLHCGACGNACVNARCATETYPKHGGSWPTGGELLKVTGCVHALGVAVGPSHACARVKVGTIENVWCWGDNAKHQLGRDYVAADPVPAPVQRNDAPWALGATWRIYAGPVSTFVLRLSEAWAWGDVPPKHAFLPTYERATAWSPTIMGEPDVSSVGVGTAHVCAVDRRGGIVCAGRNDNGQLGQGVYYGTYFAPYVQPPAEWPVPLFLAKKIAAMGDTTCAVGDDRAGNHQIYCWGRDLLGDRNSLPVRQSTRQATDVVVGGDHACLRDQPTGAWACWGRNEKAQCGGSASSFTVVPQLSSWTSPSLVAGVRFNCGIDAGKVFCWGDNADGQLGDGSTDPYSSTPREVFGLTDVVDLSASDGAACAVKTDGTVWCWGKQKNGRFGKVADGVYRKPVRIEFAAGGSP